MKNKLILKKAALLWTVAALVAFNLAGCGSKEAGDQTAEVQTAEDQTTEDQTTEDETAEDQTAEDQTAEDQAAEDETADTSDLKPFRVGCGDATNNQLNDLAGVAQRQGYLEEELNKVGYTLEVTGFQGQGPEINAALMGGSLDAGNYAELPAFTSKASGADTTVVAISDTQLKYSILAASDEVQTVADLEGKKIVVQQGTVLQYVWEQIAEDAGLDVSTVDVINSSVADAISLIQTGDTDAFISSANSIEYYAQQGLGHSIEGIPDSAYSLTLFNISNDILEETPEVAVAINKALLRAYKAVIADPQIFYDLLGEKYGENGAEIMEATYTVDGSLEYIYPEFDDELNTYVHSFYDWLNENSLLAAEVDVDTYFDSSYFEQAVQELGE